MHRSETYKLNKNISKFFYYLIIFVDLVILVLFLEFLINDFKVIKLFVFLLFCLLSLIILKLKKRLVWKVSFIGDYLISSIFSLFLIIFIFGLLNLDSFLRDFYGNFIYIDGFLKEDLLYILIWLAIFFALLFWLFKLKSVKNKREAVLIISFFVVAILILGFKDFFSELWYGEEKIINFVLNRYYVFDSLVIGMNLLFVLK